MIEFVQAKLGEPAIGDVADVLLHGLGIHAFDRALLEAQIDESVFMLDDGGAAQIQLALEVFGPDFRVFLHKGAEQLDDGQAVQRFVAH